MFGRIKRLISKPKPVKVCSKGHPKTGDNLVEVKRVKDGVERTEARCRTCLNENAANYRKKKPEALKRLSESRYSLPPETPAVLEHYKEPLRKVENGHGYLGTIAYDEETQSKTQCQICGYFYKAVGLHVVKVHKQTIKEYKKEFEIPTNVSLLAPKAKVGAHVIWESLSLEEREAKLKLMKQRSISAGRRQGTMKLYRRNLRGDCPDQLLDKIQILAKELGRRPSRAEWIKRWKMSTSAIEGQHGSWGKAVELAGLPRYEAWNKQDSEALIQRLIEFKERYGREPMTSDTKKGLLPHYGTYANHFGSWTEAKRIAFDLERK